VLNESLATAEPDDLGNDNYFKRDGVRNKTLRQLQRGQLSIENEIDLHGMTVKEAAAHLKDFIAHCYQHQQRCVRVIHGKGLSSGPDGPKLKPMTAQYLRRWDEVLAYCSARPNDGGSGALYVLLRKS
ncbi:MAG: DNA mismatch repair protein MutS, partial [Gammaproteobacteria bacterium]|nr:DNA mismatch repair protein MutS [Gammaproteobacteria bacterium]